MLDPMTAPMSPDDHAEGRAKRLLETFPPGPHRRTFRYGQQPHAVAPHLIVCETHLPHAQLVVEEGLRVSGPEYAHATLEALARLIRAYYVSGNNEVEMAAVESTVDHPRHYNAHPSGVECITIVEHFHFNIGNAIKYLWRAGEKGHELEDLKKAAWYVKREIERLTAGEQPRG